MANNDDVDEAVQDALELVRYMVESILGSDVDLELGTDREPGELCVNVHVPADKRGRIIGRHGRAARSMRNILAAADLGLHRRVTLDIVD